MSVEKPMVLDIKNLNISFMVDKKKVKTVSDVNFRLHKGDVFGIVGESGSGKSITSLSIMGLLPGIIEDCEIIFQGKDLLKASEKEMRKVRGNQISMIFQEPMTSLNPLFTIGEQLLEAVKMHTKLRKRAAVDLCVSVLKSVGLARAEAMMKEYPHQLSGGMRQRVMIAMAMICQPEILIADEPTTALDVTIQSQILSLMHELNEKTETSIIFITHDLGVVAEVCNRVIVMYSGQIVEEGDVHTIFKNPQHPYTKGLLKAVPDLRQKEARLHAIQGNVPKPGTIQNGCYFAPRCDEVIDQCRQAAPKLLSTVIDGHQVRCFACKQLREGEGNV